jgi:glutaconate CoA-transferase subunit A
MTDKFMSTAEAVDKFIHDGDQIALGGFTINRNPMSLAREIVRQHKKDLYLVVHSHGQALELLIGAGCVKRLELAYGGVARFAPTGQRFKKAFLEKTIEVEDYTNYQMTLRFVAGAMGLPFIATTSGLQTDVVNVSGFSQATRQQEGVPDEKLKIIKNPIDPESGDVVILPPLNPDVTLLHAQYAGEEGTIRLEGLSFADIEQAKAAKHVLVSCEHVVPEEMLRLEPDRNCLPPFLVDAIIPTPYGAHPTGCHMFYDYDPVHLNLFRKMARDDAMFQQYLDEWVLSLATQEDYLDKIGASSLVRIKANPFIGYAPGMDRS